jgi:hypothetical protein
MRRWPHDSKRACWLRLGVLMKLGIRAAADKELPQDHVPFDFSLLPDDKDEYIISGGVFKGREASSPVT